MPRPVVFYFLGHRSQLSTRRWDIIEDLVRGGINRVMSGRRGFSISLLEIFNKNT